MNPSSLILILVVATLAAVLAIRWWGSGPDAAEELARAQGWRHTTTALGWRIEDDRWSLDSVPHGVPGADGAGVIWQADMTTAGDAAAFIARPPPAIMRGVALEMIKAIAAQLPGAEGQAFSHCKEIPFGLDDFQNRFAVTTTSPAFVNDWLTMGRQAALLRFVEETGVVPLVSVVEGRLLVRVSGADPGDTVLVNLVILGQTLAL